MLGFGVGSSHLVVLSVRQAQCTTKSRFSLSSAFDRKLSAARRNSEADQLDSFVKDYRADDVGLIRQDVDIFQDQTMGIFFLYFGCNDKDAFLLTTTRPVVPAICRACLRTG